MANFDIRSGELIDVYGRSAKSREMTFVPARVRLNGTMFDFECYFDEHHTFPRDVIPQHADAAFVRARIPRIFGYTPIYDEDQEKSLLSEGFIAVLGDGKTAIPFECTDVYGRTSLMFSDEGPEDSVKSEIADALWELIAAETDQLDDFEQRVFHPGACIWMNFGCKNSEVYYDESDER